MLQVIFEKLLNYFNAKLEKSTSVDPLFEDITKPEFSQVGNPLNVFCGHCGLYEDYDLGMLQVHMLHAGFLKMKVKEKKDEETINEASYENVSCK